MTKKTGHIIRKAFQNIIPFLADASLDITIEGKENIPEGASKLLIVANHATFIDVPILTFVFHKYLLKIKWVINKGIYKLWYLKWVYMIHETIVVDGKTVEKIKHALDEDRWVLIFPEGGQRLCPPVIAAQEKMKPRRGAAVVALSTGVTILPVGITGADKVLPVGTFKLQARREVTVRIGKSFSYQGRDESLINDELISKTREEIIARIYELVH